MSADDHEPMRATVDVDKILGRLIYHVSTEINPRGWELREASMLEEAVRYLCATSRSIGVGKMISNEERETLEAQWERERREPSPLPWACRAHDSYMMEDEEEPIEIVDARGDTVADNVSYYAHHIKVADARLIVQRINAHEALVAALEYTREYMHPYTPADVRDKIDAALAQAGRGK
ncbi:hypothetical protein LB523_11830 [Mesorhizobium sp. ESP-6-4]|uniref:hypothetical protein n=1 Tax=Mesorhizobium sp. ESP-6-4 TaxID=2876624 RepID=UPI001CCA8119|nr:hypothetical protein [Mesorhizobium sp. ESP-6-4]MBZ9659734.1 hypothetical protein [Mesorhizobium sp. ESP-6-4]